MEKRCTNAKFIHAPFSLNKAEIDVLRICRLHIPREHNPLPFKMKNCCIKENKLKGKPSFYI